MTDLAPRGSAPGRVPDLREDLVGRAAYGAPQIDVPVRLNTNENPYPPSVELVADIASAVTESARNLNRYPDREAEALRRGLASYLAAKESLEFDVSQVWAANGSNEVMFQLCLAFGGPGRTALGFAPTYSMYPTYCRDSFTRWVTVPRENDFSLDLERAVDAVRDLRPDLVVVASPNNPTGTALPLATVSALCDAAPGLVLVDEAYAEFRRPGTPSALSLLGQFPNLAVIRTLSKAFGLAGARLGYVIAAPAVVDAARLVRLPYHLSSITQAVALAALAHVDSLAPQLAAIRAERDDAVQWLRSQGLAVADSDANFAMFGCFADRGAVWTALLDRGVLVREVGPEGWLRVTVGTGSDMARFRSAMQDVLVSGVAHIDQPTTQGSST